MNLVYVHFIDLVLPDIIKMTVFNHFWMIIQIYSSSYMVFTDDQRLCVFAWALGYLEASWLKHDGQSNTINSYVSSYYKVPFL